jgi:hypothetical protein
VGSYADSNPWYRARKNWVVRIPSLPGAAGSWLQQALGLFLPNFDRFR